MTWRRDALMGSDATPRVRAPGLFRATTHGLDVVAVRVPHEGAVVVRVVLGPHPRFVQDRSTGAHRGVEEATNLGPVVGSESDVEFAAGAGAARGPSQNDAWPAVPHPITVPKSKTRPPPRGANTTS